MNVFDTLVRKLEKNEANLSYDGFSFSENKLCIHWPYHDDDDYFYRDEKGQLIFEMGAVGKFTGEEALKKFCKCYEIGTKLSDL